jgi:hypothetical protein
MQVCRNLAILQAFHRNVDLAHPFRFRCNGVTALGLVAIRRGQADIVMLPGTVWHPIRQRNGEAFDARRLLPDILHRSDLPL